MSLRRVSRRHAHRGFSLVELMISLVIGMVVIGAVLAAYLSSGFSSRNTQAMAQITEDANVALNLLRSHLSMVGYSRPVGVSGKTFTKAYPGVGLRGCTSDFTDLSQDIDKLQCPAGAVDADPDVVAIAYEADTHNSVVGADGKPLDCIGNGLTKVVATDAYYLSYSRFYLDVPTGSTLTALYCLGEGSDTAQALVENVVDLQIQYGVAAPAVAGEDRRVGFYSTPTGMTGAQFDEVMAAKVCVVVASAAEVMDQVTPYQPCGAFSAKVTPGDRRMYRAFSTTVVMQNRSGVLN